MVDEVQHTRDLADILAVHLDGGRQALPVGGVPCVKRVRERAGVQLFK